MAAMDQKRRTVAGKPAVPMTSESGGDWAMQRECEVLFTAVGRDLTTKWWTTAAILGFAVVSLLPETKGEALPDKL
jgi:hypothetical protein